MAAVAWQSLGAGVERLDDRGYNAPTLACGRASLRKPEALGADGRRHRFALEPGRGRNTVPVSLAILGKRSLVVVVVSTHLRRQLHALVSRPRALRMELGLRAERKGGGAALSGKHPRNFSRRHRCRRVVSVYFWGAELDGQTVHVIGATPNAPVDRRSSAGAPRG